MITYESFHKVTDYYINSKYIQKKVRSHNDGTLFLECSYNDRIYEIDAKRFDTQLKAMISTILDNDEMCKIGWVQLEQMKNEILEDHNIHLIYEFLLHNNDTVFVNEKFTSITDILLIDDVLYYKYESKIYKIDVKYLEKHFYFFQTLKKEYVCDCDDPFFTYCEYCKSIFVNVGDGMVLQHNTKNGREKKRTNMAILFELKDGFVYKLVKRNTVKIVINTRKRKKQIIELDKEDNIIESGKYLVININNTLSDVRLIKNNKIIPINPESLCELLWETFIETIKNNGMIDSVLHRLFIPYDKIDYYEKVYGEKIYCVGLFLLRPLLLNFLSEMKPRNWNSNGIKEGFDKVSALLSSLEGDDNKIKELKSFYYISNRIQTIEEKREYKREKEKEILRDIIQLKNQEHIYS